MKRLSGDSPLAVNVHVGLQRVAAGRGNPPLHGLVARAGRTGARRGLFNDPSAGSPTETLLRLLLPLNDQV